MCNTKYLYTPSRLEWHCYLRDGYYILLTIVVNKDLFAVVVVVV